MLDLNEFLGLYYSDLPFNDPELLLREGEMTRGTLCPQYHRTLWITADAFIRVDSTVNGMVFYPNHSQKKRSSEDEARLGLI